MISSRPYTPTVGLKTRASNADFVAARDRIREIVPQAWIDRLIDEAVASVRLAVKQHGSGAYAWSGGKDSLALGIVMREAGVNKGFTSLTSLEWPAQLAWALEHKPKGVLRMPQDDINLDWLKERPELLFPTGTAASNYARFWHKAQDWYFKLFHPSIIFNGRRRGDGNHVPDEPFRLKSKQLHLTPVGRWTHEEVMAAIEYHGEWPPIYFYPNGFLRGSGPWPYVYPPPVSETTGWEFVYGVDPSVVRAAAGHFPAAKLLLEHRDVQDIQHL